MLSRASVRDTRRGAESKGRGWFRLTLASGVSGGRLVGAVDDIAGSITEDDAKAIWKLIASRKGWALHSSGKRGAP